MHAIWHWPLGLERGMFQRGQQVVLQIDCGLLDV